MMKRILGSLSESLRTAEFGSSRRKRVDGRVIDLMLFLIVYIFKPAFLSELEMVRRVEPG
jgi:hypothetical protein